MDKEKDIFANDKKYRLVDIPNSKAIGVSKKLIRFMDECVYRSKDVTEMMLCVECNDDSIKISPSYVDGDGNKFYNVVPCSDCDKHYVTCDGMYPNAHLCRLTSNDDEIAVLKINKPETSIIHTNPCPYMCVNTG